VAAWYAGMAALCACVSLPRLADEAVRQECGRTVPAPVLEGAAI